MATIGKVLRWFFALNAVLTAGPVLLTLWKYGPSIWKALPSFAGDFHADRFLAAAGHGWFWTYAIAPLVLMPGLGVVFTMAWWTLGMGKKGARIWSLVASAALAGTYFIGPVFLPWSVAGVLGLIVFSRKKVVEEIGRQPDRVKGDGTSTAVDWLSVVLNYGGVYFASTYWTHWAHQRGLDVDRSFPPVLVLILLAGLIHTAVHEAGHAVAALLLRYRIRHVICGPVEARIKEGKWRFQFHPLGVFLPGGAIGAAPTDTMNLRWRTMAMIAAGPFASLMLGLAAIWITLGNPGPWWKFASYVATFSLIGFVINLLPLKQGAMYSDGSRIFQLAMWGSHAQVQMAFGATSSTLVSARRLKDLDIGLIQSAAAAAHSSPDRLLLRLNASSHYVDSGRFEEAIRELELAEQIYIESEASIPLDLRVIAQEAFTWGNAFLKNNAAAARSWWDRIAPHRTKDYTMDSWKAYCALLIEEENWNEAEQAWQQGNAGAEGCSEAGAYAYDRACFAALREKLDAAMTGIGNFRLSSLSPSWRPASTVVDAPRESEYPA
jgi:hypothetical protein